jgi:AcrR family transcriptional regulator
MSAPSPSVSSPPVARRTRLDTDVRRAQLIDVGLKLFGKRPYGDVSMDEVAESAGVSHGLLYHYFPTKRSFYIEILRDVGNRLASIARPDPTLEPLDQLYVGLRAHVDFAANYPDAYRALVMGGNGADAKLLRLVERARWRGLRPIIRSLSLEEDWPELRVALRGWSSFNDGAVLEWLRRRDLTSEQVVDLMARTLLGILEVAGAGEALSDVFAQANNPAEPKQAGS